MTRLHNTAAPTQCCQSLPLFPFFFPKVCKVRTEKNTSVRPLDALPFLSSLLVHKRPGPLAFKSADIKLGHRKQHAFFSVLGETSVKQVRPTRGFSVKYIMTKGLTTERTPSQFLVPGCSRGDGDMCLCGWDRLGSPTTPTARLMCFWAQMQCPAVI